jgi:hypothetical protein
VEVNGELWIGIIQLLIERLEIVDGRHPDTIKLIEKAEGIIYGRG